MLYLLGLRRCFSWSSHFFSTIPITALLLSVYVFLLTSTSLPLLVRQIFHNDELQLLARNGHTLALFTRYNRLGLSAYVLPCSVHRAGGPRRT